MWESLIDGVDGFLRAARRLYGDGHPTAGLPSLGQAISSDLPSVPGVGAALDAADTLNDALAGELEVLCERNSHIGGLITRACDSVEFGRKFVEDESETFRSSVSALGPFTNSPAGILSLLPIALGVIASATGQIQGDLGQMGDLSDEVSGNSDGERDSVVLASSTTRSGPIGSAIDFLESVSGLPYLWGGFSPVYGFDCSGLVSAVANMVAGLDPLAERTSTGGLGPFLASRGGRRGPGGRGTVEFGWKDGPQYPGGGHTAGTVHFADRSINFEAGGNGVRFGGPALGADGFDNIMHIPFA